MSETETETETEGRRGGAADRPLFIDFLEAYCGVGAAEQPVGPEEWAARIGEVLGGLALGDEVVYEDLYGPLLLRHLGGRVVETAVETATLRGHVQVPLEVLAELRERAYRRGAERAWIRGFLGCFATGDGGELAGDPGVDAAIARADAADPGLADEMRRAIARALRPTATVLRVDGPAEIVPGLAMAAAAAAPAPASSPTPAGAALERDTGEV